MSPKAAPDYPGILDDAKALAQIEEDKAAKAEAMMAVIRDILADPNWTARVVASAVVVEDQLPRDSELFAYLSAALTDKSRVTE